MSIQIEDGSAVSKTGGSAVTYSKHSSDKNTHVFKEDGAEYLTKRTLTLKLSGGTPNPGAPGGKSNVRYETSLQVPRVLADGVSVGVNNYKFLVSAHPEMTIAQIEADINHLISGFVDAGVIVTYVAEKNMPS